MLINYSMSLNDLKHHMSNTDVVSDDDAISMRIMLCFEYYDMDTVDVPQDEWDEMMKTL